MSRYTDPGGKKEGRFTDPIGPQKAPWWMVVLYVIIMVLVTYGGIGTAVVRYNHPEYTETQQFIKLFNWSYTP